jgi:SAM-dependent methyltransferase
MSEARHDAWQAGESYDGYMGRWSRQLAPRFLDWLGVPDRLDWLDVGCGTGALSGAILARCNPKSLVAIDPSQGFIATARRNVSDQRAEFRVGDAQSLPVEPVSRDVIASALALNFVPDRHLALAEMRRVSPPRCDRRLLCLGLSWWRSGVRARCMAGRHGTGPSRSGSFRGPSVSVLQPGRAPCNRRGGRPCDDRVRCDRDTDGIQGFR